MILGCIFDEITYTCDEAEKVKEKEDQLNNKIALLGQSLLLQFSSIIETRPLNRWKKCQPGEKISPKFLREALKPLIN